MDIYATLKHMRILLIDDDEWIRDSMRLLFESEGCRLLALKTAEEGLEVLKNGAFDLIIADYKLPGMDGLTFLEKTKISHASAIRVLITAYGDDVLVEKMMQANIRYFIKKPFTSESVEAVLETALKDRSGRQETNPFESISP